MVIGDRIHNIQAIWPHGEQPQPAAQIQRVTVVPEQSSPLRPEKYSVITTGPPTAISSTNQPLPSPSMQWPTSTNQLPVAANPQLVGAAVVAAASKQQPAADAVADKAASVLLSQLGARGLGLEDSNAVAPVSKQTPNCSGRAQGPEQLFTQPIMTPTELASLQLTEPHQPGQSPHPVNNTARQETMQWPVIPLLPRSERATLSHDPLGAEVDSSRLDKLVETLVQCQAQPKTTGNVNPEPPTPSPRKRPDRSPKNALYLSPHPEDMVVGVGASPHLKQSHGCFGPQASPLPEDRPADFPILRNLFGQLHPSVSQVQLHMHTMPQDHIGDPLGLVNNGGSMYGQYAQLHAAPSTNAHASVFDEFLA